MHSMLLVKEVMSTTVVTIGPHEPLANAARLMLEQKVGCLPVVDGEKLVGILTEAASCASRSTTDADLTRAPGGPTIRSPPPFAQIPDHPTRRCARSF